MRSEIAPTLFVPGVGTEATFEVRTDHGLLLRSSKPSIAEYRSLTPGSRVWAVVRDCRALPRDGAGAA